MTAQEAQGSIFNVGAYVREPTGPGEVPAVGVPMSPEMAAAVRYLQRSLGDTSFWLSRVLVTPTHKEARITAFLSTWAYEQHWLAASLGVLASTAPDDQRNRGLGSKWGALVEALFANVYGHAFIGLHMAERLIDSWLVDVMLERVQQQVPAAGTAVAHVRATLTRQRVFFFETAIRELAGSRRTRMLARWRLSRRIFPLGANREQRAATAATFVTLFGTDATWATALDARISELPGLSGLGLMRRVARQAKPAR